jgi:adenine specific DNA methylase Mod
MAANQLYYGDNLKILRQYLADQSVDLVYLDPPFNSNQDYNVLFKERNGARSAAQVKAFKDTWVWDTESSRAYQEMVEHGPEQVSKVLRAFQTFLGFNDMLAYLSMMAPRLVEMRRVLKDTGSIYLHCDPSASHYLKLLMDAVFGAVNFVNEIAWKRTSAHSDVAQGAVHVGRIHDVILWYAKTGTTVRNPVYLPYSQEYIDKVFRHVDESGRRYQTQPLHAKQPGGDTRYEWKGQYPPTGRYWAFSKANMEKLDRKGRIMYSKHGVPRYKIYLDESPGRALQDLWDDIGPVHTLPKERLGYPTQKPEALLERILTLSSNEGDLVLDPFCGCGTTIAVAQRLSRRWIGIDVTCLAINLMRRRLESAFGGKADFEVIGEPTAYSEAKQLAAENPYQFQWWALDLVGARPVVEKKGADKGVDGRLVFHDDESGEAKQVIFSVKSGHITAAHVRDLRGTQEREQAEMACLLCLEEPTQPMRGEAAGAGFYQSPLGNKMYPRMQILTVKELLEGKKLQLPEGRVDVTFKKAPRAKRIAQKGIGL